MPLEHPRGAAFALTRSAKALSLSAAGCLPGRGARRAPISSTRLIRALSLAALLSLLACTCGVGGRQGWTTAVAVGTLGACSGARARGGGQLPERPSDLPASGVPGNGDAGASTVKLGSRTEVVSTVRNNPKEASCMSGRGVGTAEEGGDRAGGGKAFGNNFGKAVNESVGPPIDSGEEMTVA